MSIENARRLRKRMTDAERQLWRWLRGLRPDGWTFRRQEPIDGYIVDFVCFKARLILEIDGGQHSESETDKVRDDHFRSEQFRTLRFWNSDVLTRPDGVYHSILEALGSAQRGAFGAAPSSSSG